MENRRFDIWGSGFWPIFFFILWLPVQGHAAAGDLDTAFDPVGLDGIVTTDFAGGNDVAYALAIQPDGKILVAGSARLGNLDFAIVRYEWDAPQQVIVVPSGDFSGNGGCVLIPGEEGDWTLAGLLGLVLSILILRKFRRGFRF